MEINNHWRTAKIYTQLIELTYVGTAMCNYKQKDGQTDKTDNLSSAQPNNLGKVLKGQKYSLQNVFLVRGHTSVLTP